VTAPRHLPRAALDGLVSALRERGYAVIGPVERDGAVVYDEIANAGELPKGLRDRQAPGAYRLERTESPRVFDVVNGPGSLKRFFFAPREPLLQIEVRERSFAAQELVPVTRRIAVIGVRACDLAALAMQDRIFLGDRFPDPWYAARRRDCFLVAVSCTHSAPTCFCVSMGTGPEPTEGFDLALTEFDDGFLARAGTPEGEAVLSQLPAREATPERIAEEREALGACTASMRRKLDTSDLPALLYENLDHPRWDDVAERCLSCGNCTMVCPTCFCHDERDEPLVSGDGSVRVREWDSCFNPEHAQVHGTNFRPQIRERYRQWLVHKLASWIDQFGSSGCVGCGRCITWCPVGIDLTEEISAIRGRP
jgi:sulfhydrogenase subunit beta (sulfur reductase)